MGDRATRNVILDWLFGAPIPGRDRGSGSVSGPSGDRGFQPFGFRFEVRSYLPPAKLKAALRSRMKDWFDAKPGARGWIVGPFMCLWFSAFDRYGPMVLAMVKRDDLGTRVTGRAGSDLNGLALFAILMPLLAFALYQMVAAEDYTLRQVIILGGLILLSPLVFWWSHKDRRRAEPLVRFIRDTVARAEGRIPAASASSSALGALTLTAAGEDRLGPTAEEVHDALLAAGEGDFVILAAGPETYIQTASWNGGYILEMRDGNRESHFRATHYDKAPGHTFAFEEVRQAFLAYAAGSSSPSFLRWEPLRLTA